MKNAMLIGWIILAAACASSRPLRQSSPVASGQSGSASAPAAPEWSEVPREALEKFDPFDPITSSGP